MDWFDADVTILSYNVYLQFGRYAFLLHTLVGTWFLGKVWTTHLLRHPAIEMIFWTKTHQFNWVKPATKNTTKTLYYTPKQTLTCVFVRTRALLLCSSCTSLITPKQLSVLRQLVWNFTTSLTLLKKMRAPNLVFLGRLADGTHSDQILRLKRPRPDPPGDDLSQWPPCQPPDSGQQRKPGTVKPTSLLITAMYGRCPPWQGENETWPTCQAPKGLH